MNAFSFCPPEYHHNYRYIPVSKIRKPMDARKHITPLCNGARKTAAAASNGYGRASTLGGKHWYTHMDRQRHPAKNWRERNLNPYKNPKRPYTQEAHKRRVRRRSCLRRRWPRFLVLGDFGGDLCRPRFSTDTGPSPRVRLSRPPLGLTKGLIWLSFPALAEYRLDLRE